MFIETLEFTIPVELCNIFSSLQKGPASNVEFPASVNSYGTTQDASVQVVLRSNKLTFKVDGVSSNASMISKSECKTLKLSVFDVDRTLMPQENDNDNYNANNMSTVQTLQQTVYLSNPAKRLHESSVSMPQPASKSSRTSFSESPRPRSPVHAIHRRPHSQASASPSNHSQQSKSKNDSQVNVKQEPEDPDLIEIEPDPEPNNIVPKKETPYMQIDYSSDVPHTQTSQAALERLSHPQSSHSQSPGSSSSSFHQNVPHVPDYAEPSTSQARYGDQSADDFLVFQDENDDGDDNEADYSNDDVHGYGTTFPVGRIVSRQDHPVIPFQVRTHSAEHSPWPRTVPSSECYPCPRCHKVFTNYGTRKYHIESVHDGLSFTCVCGKVYSYRTGLQKHWRKSKHCAEAMNML
ncbi:hydrogen peroxide stress regulator 1-like isoform X25 [Haliotis rufescens]|uniref:hydrogen peroxide stress regulator 1-like isoform X25 n=1 Tax=Haliotis rufescens TaxID=6454 RepID=UPI001EAFCDF7|nr:hydrogen peroxide stress regulator 1-like isoform X25 [Haliotis rufescens]XP_048247230.1 hydrogen peroxide stress regulator 1-like isoform X25 [Haliotis rufescens]